MKSYTIDPFDVKSIERAITLVNKHEAWRKNKIDLYLRRLANIGAEAARNAYYGGSVDPNMMKTGNEGLRVSVEKTDNGYAIKAEGSQVVFLEFGAGVPTQDHELSGPLPIEIMPGSWSEGPDGAHTWSKWLEDGRRFEDYPYNKTPRMGMWEAYKAIVAAQERIAKEVFQSD